MKIALVLLLCALTIGITACTANDNNGQPLTEGRVGDNVSPYYNNDFNNRQIMGQDGLNDRNNNRVNTNTRNTNAEAKRMADTAGKVRGVDDATVVIAGGNVYVALDLEDRLQSTQANKVEKEVYNKLSKMANRYRIMITSDDDLYGRLRDVGDGLRAGTPVNVYDNDFRLFDNNFRSNIR